MTGTVGVVIVVHDSAATLRRCVEAALAQAQTAELVVVDNASRDDWRAQLPADPRIRSIVNPDNRGFAAACNQGAATLHADWLLFLNPDCFLPSNAMSKILQDAAVDDDVLRSAQLLNPDGTPQRAGSGAATPTPARALRWAFGGSRGTPAATERAADETWVEVDAVSGALMLLPNRMFRQLDGFDEGYRLHCEDLDLCRRVRLAGGRIELRRDLGVEHVKGSSSRRRPLWIEFQKHRGMLRYFNKFDAVHSPWWLRLIVPFGVWLRYPFAAMRAWWRARINASD